MENTSANTMEKSPEMSQTKEAIGSLGQLLELESASFQETSFFSGFQRQDNSLFSSVSNKIGNKSRKKGPDYRRINRYFKSSKQYWRERNRRKTVWQLHSEGLTYPQIATKLGVSEKTVQRDMAKVAPYWERKMINQWRKMEEERRDEFKRNISGLPLSKQFEYLHRENERLHNMWKTHDYVKKTLTFTINLPEILRGIGGQPYGRPWITSKPNSLNCTLHDLRIQFCIRMQGKTFHHSTLTFK